MLHSRDLVWDGVLNVRDLGGHPTEDGRETQFGRIVRADNIRRLSDEGWKALVRYGVRTIVDLRTEDELAADAPAELPVEVLHAPFMVDAPEIFAAAEAASSRATDVAEATREVYLIFLEGFRPNVANVIRTIAEAPEGAVLVHCAGGKDRTGLTVAFLLRMAGVGLEDIAADYALSEERLRPRHERWYAEAADEAELERLRRITATPAAAMVGVLQELERRYGSVEGFLRSGPAPEDIGERVRARLLD
ncbi:MAG TPA: tyrosine-protein phosphatase [Gaiellaceae bacterium]|nr:tyrosine-protein phosphatase [Gaiellaceae bacterium]